MTESLRAKVVGNTTVDNLAQTLRNYFLACCHVARTQRDAKRIAFVCAAPQFATMQARVEDAHTLRRK